MSRLTLSLSCVDYDRTRAIFEGKVRVAGCDIVPTAMSPEEAFHRAFKFQEFDISELSMSSYMNQVAKDGSPYVGIPAFLSRMFRHSSIYIRTDSGIDKPEDLKGKVVGVPEYQMTAALWVRGMLQDEYGLQPADMNWRDGGLEEGGKIPNVNLKLPKGVHLETIPPDRTLSEMLDTGEIDALISARAPSCFGQNADVTRLFQDYRAAEEAYYKKTGLFPIMHIVGIRKSLVEQHPWLPVNILNAFVEAKQICYMNLSKVGHLFTTLPWPVNEFEAAEKLMGEDYWPYGFHKNAAVIEAMSRYSFEQGLTARNLTAEDLFAPSTFELAKV
ncbi:MAG: PhnD/SsuA/transferrin family substrate-binding protein [Pseudomonadota bacterium]|nr:PhnD/SsuA/transferrin family substrate-binding protein [Pseudomonadota bacterium]